MADEYVKRDDVLAVLGRNWRSMSDANDAIQQSILDIGNLFTAADRPMVSRWEDVKYTRYFRCGNCSAMELVATDFCPNCGADMRQT